MNTTAKDSASGQGRQSTNRQLIGETLRTTAKPQTTQLLGGPEKRVVEEEEERCYFRSSN